MSDIEQIKSNVDIVALIGQDVELRPSGKYFTGRCPFHDDRTPSLIVFPETGTFKCMSASCGKQGDVFTYIEERDKCNFAEAKRRLAAMAGVEYREFRRDTSGIDLRENAHPNILTMDMMRECCTIDKDVNGRPLITDATDFGAFLHTIFTPEQVRRIVGRYCLGRYAVGRHVIFWEIDKNYNVRTGKVMPYSANGHRIKEQGARYVHTDFLLPADWKKNECLFGEHLLKGAKESDTIAIVESEKTACLMSEYLPEYIWMACGGSNGLTAEKMSGIKEWPVILFPDADAYVEWKQKAEAYKEAGMKIAVSDWLETYATPEQKARKVDIADLFLETDTTICAQQPPAPPTEQIQTATPVAPTTGQPKQAGRMVGANSVLYFDSMKELCRFVFQWQRNGVPPHTGQAATQTQPTLHTQQNAVAPATPPPAPVATTIIWQQPQRSIIPDDYFFFDRPEEMYYFAREWKRIMPLPRG